MPRVSRSALRRAGAIGVAAAVCSPAVVVPAGAQEEHVLDGDNVASTGAPTLTTTSLALDGVLVRNMGDVAGEHTRPLGVDLVDLGAMAPLGDGSTGEFAMIFGDSFINEFGQQWMSPMGVVARQNRVGTIQLVRALNGTGRVSQMVSYDHAYNKTLLPSDVININGTLYMQAMWNEPFGNVTSTQVYRSDNDGKTWQRAGRAHRSRIGGVEELISWEMGPDGDYVYAVSTKFGRRDPVYLWRARPADIADQSKWEIYNTNTRSWGDRGTTVLDRNEDGSPLKAGEMNLRYIDGYWVLAMFNESTLSVEVRISDTLERDWNDVRAVTIVKHGPWWNRQTPDNWSQPYGGYIVPGSTLNNLDLVISQWNTGQSAAGNTRPRYTSTQFNTRGLRWHAEDYDEASAPQTTKRELDISPNRAASAPATTGTAGTGSSGSLAAVAIVLGIIAGVAGLAALSWPVLRPLLPPQLQAALPL